MWGPLRHWQCSEDNINSTKTTIEIQGHSFCVQYTTDKHIVRAIQCINLRMVVSNDILGLCQFLSGCLYYSCFVFLTVELHARIEKKTALSSRAPEVHHKCALSWGRITARSTYHVYKVHSTCTNLYYTYISYYKPNRPTKSKCIENRILHSHEESQIWAHFTVAQMHMNQ